MTIDQVFAVYLIVSAFIVMTVRLNTVGQIFLKHQWQLWLCNGILALAAIAFYAIVSMPRYELLNDFYTGYYPAGYLSLEDPANLYNTDLYQNVFGFVNIPIVALLFAPFAWLPRPIAATCFALLSGLAVLAICYLLLRVTKAVGKQRLAIIGLVIISGPLYHSLKYGNTSHFVILILLGALFFRGKRDFLAGILLAIAALNKLPLLLLVVYYFARKRWQVVAAFSGALLFLVGTSLLIYGVDLHLVWGEHVGQFAGRPITAYNVQSLDAFLGRLLLNTTGELENWDPFDADNTFKLVRYTLLSALVGGSIFVLWRAKAPRTSAEQNLEFSIVLCLLILIAPLAWTHYYLFLLIPFGLYAGNKLAVPRGRIWTIGMWLSIVLISLPAINARTNDSFLIMMYSRFLSSHYFLGGVLLLGVLLAARWYNARQTASGVAT